MDGDIRRDAAHGGTRVSHITCPLCEATCGLEVTTCGREVVSIRGDQEDVFRPATSAPKAASNVACARQAAEAAP